VLDSGAIDVMIQAMATTVGPGCAIFTHEFRGAASRVPVEATAFGLRRDHVLVEILAALPDPCDELKEQRHRHWAKAALRAFDGLALAGGYTNFLVEGDAERVAKSYGPNVERLVSAKRHYDPDNVFHSVIPLPACRDSGHTSARDVAMGH
jgi:FAD/FMN-containing dehydrogenase